MDFKRIKLQEIKKGTILISGFYSEKGITSGVALLNVKVNEVANAEISKSFIKIPTTLHQKFLNINCPILDIEIEQQLIDEDEGLLIIGTNKTYLGNGKATNKPILLIKVDKNKTLQWINIIPRKTGVTLSYGDGSESFFIHKYKKKYFVFYQDGNSNKNKNLDEDPNLFDAAYVGGLTIVEINENGKMFKNTSLFDKCANKPEYFMKVSDNKILVKGGSYYKPYKYELIGIN
jgi:hypothetical protein